METHPQAAEQLLAQAPEVPMTTHLPIVEEVDAPPAVRTLYAEFRRRFGRPEIPGILKCFATHPPLLEHMMGLAESMLFNEGALGRRNKELIATFVSARNQCAYCADSHGAALLQQNCPADLTSPHTLEPDPSGLLQAALASDPSSPAFNPSEQALLRMVARITDHAGRLDPPDLAALRAASWSDLHIAEAIHLAALFACFNRVVNAFGLPSQSLLATSISSGSPAYTSAGGQ